MASTIDTIRNKNASDKQAIEDQTGDSAIPTESPADEQGEETTLQRLDREAKESAKKQEEELHKKNTGSGGVDSGKL